MTVQIPKNEHQDLADLFKTELHYKQLIQDRLINICKELGIDPKTNDISYDLQPMTITYEPKKETHEEVPKVD